MQPVKVRNRYLLLFVNIIEADSGKELFLAEFVQDAVGLCAAVPAGAELVASFVLCALYIGIIEPRKIVGKAVLVVILAEPAHRCEELVQV